MKICLLSLLILIIGCEDLNILHPNGGQDCVINVDGKIIIGEDALRLTCHTRSN